MKRVFIAIAAAGMLAGCAGATTATTPADKTAALNATYLPIRTLAVLCAGGVSKPCQDPNVSANVAKAIPLADAAVAEAIKQINANPDQANATKWSGYAMSAIGILAKALAVYDVKS